MSTIQRRIEALQAVQDTKCADCWERLIDVATDLHLALEHAGIDEALARKYLLYLEAITDDEGAQVQAVLPLMQDEIIAANEQCRQWVAMRPSCEAWFTKHTGGTSDEYTSAIRTA